MAILAPFRIRRIIEDIRIYNGGGGHKPVYPPGICVEVYENVRQLSASTGEIARDLYTGESRFVYELIQNAEDNSYGRSQNDDPYISFTLMPNEIIVENNEAGFTEKDVRSICKVGDSTKSNRTGYISERGLGFKSVFQVAWKVRIQSRRFDFRFEHLPADTTGLGMVTPFYEMFGPGWPDGTRMTLTLLDPSDFSKRSEDLLGIPDVLILFLSKLRRIEVSVLDSNTGTTSSVVHESHDGGGEQQGSPMWILTRKNDEISRKYFHVERETFEGLPEDPARKKRDRAEVVLAFPTTSDSKPIFEPQLTYSFLPIGNFGFRVC